MQRPGRTAAPAPLDIVQDLLNSRSLESPTDELHSPAALALWYAQAGLGPPAMPIGREDVRRAITVREGLRALVLGHGGAPPDMALVDALDEVALTVRLHVSFGVIGGLQPASRRLADVALGWLLIVVEDARSDGRWSRFKGCREPTCRWVFYDTSKNRSGRWCSMQLCGTSNKQRAQIERRRAGQETSPRYATGATSSRRPTSRSPVNPARAARPPNTTT